MAKNKQKSLEKEKSSLRIEAQNYFSWMEIIFELLENNAISAESNANETEKLIVKAVNHQRTKLELVKFLTKRCREDSEHLGHSAETIDLRARLIAEVLGTMSIQQLLEII
ncbi:MAG: hypothetical protein AAFO95_19570 [Cyanobacteria bacterium J06600_6]